MLVNSGQKMFSIPKTDLIKARNKWKSEYINAEPIYADVRKKTWNKYNVDQYVVDAYVFLMCLIDSTARIDAINEYIENQK